MVSEEQNTAGIKIGFVHFIALIAAVGGLLFGFDTGVIAGALIFIKRDLGPTIIQQEVIVSIAVLGALFGAIASGRLADIFGRRKLLLGASFLFIVGTLLASMAHSVHTLVIGRFTLGLAIGIASYAAPLFISEVAPPKARGGLVTLNVIAITVGQVVAFSIDLLLEDTVYNWRWMMGVGIIPAFVLMIGMLYAPSSPRWLIFKGLKDEAIKILKRIRRRHDVREEIRQMEESLLIGVGSWKAIFSRKVMPVMIIGLALGIFQQFVGINTVMYYGPEIFGQVGFSGDTPQILGTLGLGVVNALMATCVLLTVDRWGRRRLMILGTALAAVSLLIFGFTVRHASYQWVSVVCLITYIAGYGISLGVLFWVLISEIFPLEIRGLAMSIVTGVQWGANFLVSLTFLTLLNKLGPSNTFWLYGFMAFLACAFSYFFVPETKGVSLEQIEKNLYMGRRTRDLGLPVSKPDR